MQELPTPAGRRQRIAVINDDDTAFLDLMSELLNKEEGYEGFSCIGVGWQNGKPPRAEG